MRACRRAAWWLIAGVVLAAVCARGLAAREATRPAAGTPMLRDVAVLEDPAAALTIADVAGPDVASRFAPLDRGRLVAGYTRSAYWLRFTLDAPAGEWWLEILPAFLDDLRLFFPEPADAGPGMPGPGPYVERRAGDNSPFSAREVPHRGFVFKLTTPDASPRTCYLRVETTSSFVVFPRVFSPEAFWPEATFEHGWFLAAPVMMLTVVLLNLATWFWLRDGLGLWFIGFLASLTGSLASASGLLSQYLLPDSPRLAYWFTGVCTLCAVSAGHAVYRRLFAVERSQPLFYWLYQVSTAIPLVGILVFFVTGDNRTSASVALATVPPMNLVGIWLAIRTWRRGRPGASVVLLANILSMLGLFFYSALLQGVSESEAVFIYGPTIAVVGSVLALQFAVGERYREIFVARQLAVEDAAREKRIRELSEAAEARIRVTATENERLVGELREALDNVKTLSGFLPICMHCKKVRDDAGYWERIEQYISTHTDATFSHGVCPDCMRQHYPDVEPAE